MRFHENLSIRRATASRPLWAGLLFSLFLSGCAQTVQTTSGQAYLSKYPTSAPLVPPEGTTLSIDEEVRQVAAVEPTLRFPARIGLARIDSGSLTPVPQAEAAVWMKVAENLGPRFGTFLPISPMIAGMVSGGDSEDGWAKLRFGRTGQGYRGRYDDATTDEEIYQTVRMIRLGAARQHLDAVLVYEVYGTSSIEDNPLWVGNLTLIGAWILPSQNVEAVGYANALLLDVRNGYPYGTASATATEDELASYFGADDVGNDVREAAMTAAAVNLAPEVESMARDLVFELAALRN